MTKPPIRRRRRAPLAALVANAVRQTYGSSGKRTLRRKIDLTTSRVVAGGSADAAQVRAEDVRAALYD